MTKETLAKTAKQMDELGTTVTPEAVKASREFQLAFADVKDVLAAFAINLGNKVMPTLTVFLEWISGVGTKAVQAFRVVLDWLGEGFSFLGQILGPIITILGDLLVNAVSALVDWYNSLIESVNDLLRGVPLLGDLLAWLEGLFSKVGGSAGLFGIVLKVISTVIQVVAGALSGAITLISMFATLVLGTVSSFGKALEELRTGSFSRAGEVLDAGMRNTMASVEAKGKRLEETVKKTKQGVVDTWRSNVDEGGNVADSNGQAKFAKAKPADGGDLETKDTSKKLLEKWKEQLNEIKSLEQNWFTWSAGRELEFWEEKLKHVRRGTDAYRGVLAEVVKLRKEVSKEERESEIKDLKSASDAKSRDADAELAEIERLSKRKADALKFSAEEQKTQVKTGTEIASMSADETQKADIIFRGAQAEKQIEDKLAVELAALRQKELEDKLRIEQLKLDAVRERILLERQLSAGNDVKFKELNAEEAKAYQEAQSPDGCDSRRRRGRRDQRQAGRVEEEGSTSRRGRQDHRHEAEGALEEDPRLHGTLRQRVSARDQEDHRRFPLPRRRDQGHGQDARERDGRHDQQDGLGLDRRSCAGTRSMDRRQDD